MDRPSVLGDQRPSPMPSGDSIRDHVYRYSLADSHMSTKTHNFC